MTQDVPATAAIKTAPPVAVQILTVIFYAGFAISVSIVAMAMFGLIGVVLAVLFAWQWARMSVWGGAPPAAAVPEAAPLPPTGNASFDAYRADTLARLDAERHDFERFMDRLRQAHDAEEFDRFLAETRTAAPA